jgi:hypothetical protein
MREQLVALGAFAIVGISRTSAMSTALGKMTAQGIQTGDGLRQ